jgi:hypothetical protein
VSTILNGMLFGIAFGAALVGEMEAFLVSLSIAVAATYLGRMVKGLGV